MSCREEGLPGGVVSGVMTPIVYARVMSVKTNVYFDDDTHEKLREEAFKRHTTMSAIIRTAVDEYLAKAPPPAAGYTPTWARKRGY